MTRPARGEIVRLLVEAGAEDESAERSVAPRGWAGLTPVRMRAWLTHPQRGYGIKTDHGAGASHGAR